MEWELWLKEYNLKNHKPKALYNCGHTICKSCCKKLLNKSQITCPKSNKVSIYKENSVLVTNFALLELQAHCKRIEQEIYKQQDILDRGMTKYPDIEDLIPQLGIPEFTDYFSYPWHKISLPVSPYPIHSRRFPLEEIGLGGLVKTRSQTQIQEEVVKQISALTGTKVQKVSILS